MPDEKPETAPPVDNEIPEDPPTPPAPAPDPEPPSEPGETVPKWGKDLQESIAALAALVTKPPKTGSPELPDDGDEVLPPDDSPAKPPWTHRKLFG